MLTYLRLQLGLGFPDVPIKALAVWDTVGTSNPRTRAQSPSNLETLADPKMAGSLGIPRIPLLQALGLQSSSIKAYKFYDTSLGDAVENAFQALALDEQRAAFTPTLWEKKAKNKTVRLFVPSLPALHV